MKKLFERAEVILVASISILTLVCVLLFLRAFGQPLWTQEASGWAQAVGSVAAILVAIRIAHTDTRLRREDEYALARVAASDMIHSARIMKIRAEDCSHSLALAQQFGYRMPDLVHAAQYIQFLSWWTVNELAKLTPLPNSTAAKLASAQSFVRDALVLLQSAIDRRNRGRDQNEINQAADPAIKALQAASAHIATVIEEFEQAIASD